MSKKVKRVVPTWKFNLNIVEKWGDEEKARLMGRLEALKESGVKLGPWGNRLLERLENES